MMRTTTLKHRSIDGNTVQPVRQPRVGAMCDNACKMSAKRRRLLDDDDGTEDERDIYEEAMKGGAATNIVLPYSSSWFHRVEWFRFDAAATTTTTTTRSGGSGLQEKIRSLRQELVVVKRKLGPAAERCAEASRRARHEKNNNNESDRGLGNGRSQPPPTRTAVASARSEFASARRACNPFESLGEGREGGLNDVFMNRSAVKLANVDAVLDFALSQSLAAVTIGPDADHDNRGGGSRDSFRFVDLCGAPGGFSEYLLKRCAQYGVHSSCYGYGMSLVGKDASVQWKIDDDWYYVENGVHCRYQICYGEDGSGDVCHWPNIEHLKRVVGGGGGSDGHGNDRSKAELVNLVVADGGLDAQRDAEDQEDLTQNIVVCQAAAALELIRRGGALVIKMFGFQSTPIRAMMSDMSRMFDSTIALKPVSSRPASAERYVVFAGFKGTPLDWSGLTWEKILLQPTAVSDEKTSSGDSPERQCLNQYLDEFDCDMLSLNLKACASILSYLERNLLRLSREEPSGAEDQVPHFSVDIKAFKAAWYL